MKIKRKLCDAIYDLNKAVRNSYEDTYERNPAPCYYFGADKEIKAMKPLKEQLRLEAPGGGNVLDAQLGYRQLARHAGRGVRAFLALLRIEK